MHCWTWSCLPISTGNFKFSFANTIHACLAPTYLPLSHKGNWVVCCYSKELTSANLFSNKQNLVISPVPALQPDQIHPNVEILAHTIQLPLSPTHWLSIDRTSQVATAIHFMEYNRPTYLSTQPSLSQHSQTSPEPNPSVPLCSGQMMALCCMAPCAGWTAIGSFDSGKVTSRLALAHLNFPNKLVIDNSKINFWTATIYIATTQTVNLPQWCW